jgi:transposase
MHYKFKTKPYQHQLNALARSWDKEYFAYFMEMGTGKVFFIPLDRDWETT